MPRVKLSDRLIRSLTTEKLQEDFWDENFSGGSFGLRVTEKGRKSFVLMYRTEGRQVRNTMGSYPSVGLAEARKKAEMIRGEVAKGEDPAQKKKKLGRIPTLKAHYETFRRVYLEQSGAVRNSTRDHYLWACEKHIMKSRLSKKKLDQITKMDLEKYIAELVQQGYAKDTIDGIVRVLRKLFSRAVDHELVSRNPVRGLGQFYSQAPVRNKDIDPYNSDEVALFLRTALRKYPDHYFLFLTAIHTGLRQGEVQALWWTDIDFKRRRIHVQRNYSHGQMNPPKTKRGKRHVDMSDFLTSELRRWQTKLREKWLAKGENEIPKWVFPNRAGNMTDFHNLKNRQFKKTINEAGLRYIPYHGLRDTFATLLLMSGTPISYISEQLGHRDPRVTVDHYARWLPSSNREVMNSLPTLAQAAKSQPR